MLAFCLANRYHTSMVPDLVRRISMVLVALALAFGPGGNGVYASSMGAKMAMAASSDAYSPSKCGDCGATKAGMLAGACSVAYCSGLTAFSFAASGIFDWPPADTLPFGDTRHLTGRADAPDPYPPRPTIL